LTALKLSLDSAATVASCGEYVKIVHLNLILIKKNNPKKPNIVIISKKYTKNATYNEQQFQCL
jgi:hypothetical protein